MRRVIEWCGELRGEFVLAIMLIATIILAITSSGCCSSVAARRAWASRLVETQAIIRRGMVPDPRYHTIDAQAMDCGEEVCALKEPCLAHGQEAALMRLAEEER